jgi:hypothetical protein
VAVPPATLGDGFRPGVMNFRRPIPAPVPSKSARNPPRPYEHTRQVSRTPQVPRPARALSEAPRFDAGMNACESAYWAGARDAAAAIYCELNAIPSVGPKGKARARELMIALTVRGGAPLARMLREDSEPPGAR